MGRLEQPARPAWFFWVTLVVVLGALVIVARWDANGQQPARSGRPLKLADIPFNGERAYQHLKDICALGPRVSGTKGMAEQQALLEKHFTDLGGKVSFQRFEQRHPVDGSRVAMANLIVEWNPAAKERILLCCHYDTRPYPDRDPDPRKRKGVFLGANDGASGAALLMELGRMLPELKMKRGVDFVFFDAEELVYDDSHKYFLGSEYFARTYVGEPPGHKYVQGVLLDMVGDAELQLMQEVNSLRDPPTRELIGEIWGTARKLGVSEFIPRGGHEVRDDHLALIHVARIPTCDIIDFDYPRPRTNYWHTTHDTPDKCSALSLAKVGWVLHEWLRGK